MKTQLTEKMAENVHTIIAQFHRHKEEVFSDLSPVNLKKDIEQLEESLGNFFDIFMSLIKKLKGEIMAEEGQPPLG